MKRLILGLGLSISFLLTSMGVRAEEPGRWADRNGWEIVAGFQKALNGSELVSDYWSINAGAGYRLFFFKGFNFNPQVRFSYRNQDYEQAGWMPDYTWDCLLSVRPILGYKWKMLELFTGPTMDARLFHNSCKFIPGLEPYPVVMAWQFGVGADLTKGFAVRLDFNLPMTKFNRMYKKRGRNYFEVSVAYRLR